MKDFLYLVGEGAIAFAIVLGGTAAIIIASNW